MRVAVFLACLLCMTGIARAQETVLFYSSSPGDYIGAGEQKYYTPQQLNFGVSRNSINGVRFEMTNFNSNPSVWWYLDFAAANNTTLVPGTYTNAVRYPFQTPNQNGLSFSGQGRGCNTLTGNFTILEAIYGLDGSVLRFAADFEQHCEGGAAALFGGVRYNSTVLNSVSTLNSVSPELVASGAAATLTLDGSNFMASSFVRWAGNDRPATFVSSSRITVTIPATDLTAPGSAQIVVITPGVGGGASNSHFVTIVNPIPTVSTLNPSTLPAAGQSFTLTVTGSRFIQGSEVRWNGSSRITTFVSSTQLTAAIPAGDIAGIGTAPVTVFNPEPGGGTSGPLTFTIGNPVPAVVSLSPATATVGDPSLALTVTGANFLTSSVVRWKGSTRPTTFVSSTQLLATIPAADLTVVGNAAITVSTPSPGGGTSNTTTFVVLNPIPTITSLTPPSTAAGGPPFVLTVNGSRFVAGATIRWNGVSMATFVTSSQLIASIPASEIANTGTAQISVLNPGPGGGVSNELSLTVGTPAAASYPYPYYFAQVAFAGGWQTVLTLINYSTQSVTCETSFYADSGAPLPVPFGGAPAATRTDTLAAGASLHQTSTGNLADAIAVGWALTRCTGPLKASILFRSFQGGVANAEAGLNAMTSPATRFVTFAGSETGVAYANPSAQPAAVTITALDSSGRRVGETSLALPSMTHGARMIGDLLGLQNFTGSIQIVSSVPIVTLSLNFEAAPVFSSLPSGELDGSTPLATGL